MTPKQKQRRDRILSVALDHVSQFGYEDVNMRDLAEAAGVSPTTLYRQFDSKESLILASVKDLIEQITSTVAEKEAAGIRRLFTLLRSFAGGFVADPKTAGVIPALLLAAEPGAPATEVLLTNAIKARHKSAIDMQKVGEIDPKCDAEHLARQLTMATWGPLLLWAKGFVTTDELADELVKAAIWSLLPVLTKKGIAKTHAEIKKHPELAVLRAPLRANSARP